MKNISIFFAALIAVLFSVAETNAQITPPYYNPANVRITGGTINGTVIGGTTAAAGNFTALSATTTATTDGVTALRSETGASIGTAYAVQGISNGASGFQNIGVYATAANAAINNYSIYSNAGIIKQADATNSTSTTTGSLITAGGLGVAKKAYFGGATTTSSASINIENNDPAIRLKWTDSPSVDKNIYEIRNVGAVGHEYLQFRTINDALSVFTNTMNLWNSGGIYMGNTPTDPGAGKLQIGNGSTTSAGLIAGYLGTSGYGSLWSTGVTPSTTNYSFTSNAASTALNASTNINLSVANSPIVTVTGTQATFHSDMVYDKTITTPGTTGAQTINKTTGRVNFAAAATSLVVTNSLATVNSICHVTKATNDATMRLGACVAAAGSITIYVDVAPAAETAVNFTITN